MTYSQKLKDPRWQKKRLEVMHRDGWACLDCGNSEATLTVHHCLYQGEPWNADVDLLMTLCLECHSTRHELEQEARAISAKISTLMQIEEFYEFVCRLSKVAQLATNRKERSK